MISDSHSTAALPLFDLHCDTLYELYKQKLPFDNDRLQITADTAGRFSPYTQVFTIWSEHSLSEEDAWQQFLQILAYKDTLSFPDDLRPILAVEGGGLLASRRERLEILAEKGVRLLTLVWQDHCCIGGAWNTSEGLTPFGREAVRDCFSLGILPDLSHASDKMFYECAELASAAGKPIIASHSDARAVFGHRRNLTDDMFRVIRDLQGLVGLSMAAVHLCPEEKPCTVDSVLLHAEHDLSLGGEKVLCLGCDFDGIAKAPEKIENAGCLPRLADAFASIGYSDDLILDLFYRNAEGFFRRNGLLSTSSSA